MQEAVGSSLALAVGIALSPIPIVAVTLMLVTPRARSNGPAFVVGWLVGLAVVGAVVLGLAGGVGARSEGEPAEWVSVLDLALGVVLLLVAVRQWRGRPRGDDEPATPGWMGAVDGFSPVKALVAGIVLVAANPKNLLLAVGGAAAIARTDLSGGGQAAAYAVFALVATLGVAAPVVVYFALGRRAGPILERLRRWMAHNNAVIIAVICLLIGAKLIGDAIAGL